MTRPAARALDAVNQHFHLNTLLMQCKTLFGSIGFASAIATLQPPKYCDNA